MQWDWWSVLTHLATGKQREDVRSEFLSWAANLEHPDSLRLSFSFAEYYDIARHLLASDAQFPPAECQDVTE